MKILTGTPYMLYYWSGKMVKDIIVKPIKASIANEFVKKHHYSGKVVPNSSLHLGCFKNGVLHGVMSFGSSMDKRKVVTLVNTGGDGWNSFLELNRMAFDDTLPKNSESRCLSVAFRLIKKNYPHIKWIISFSDGTASGDGTIYRAVGFYLTQIKSNSTIWVFPDGERIASLSLTNGGDLATRKRICEKYGAEFTSKASMESFKKIGAYKADGFQLRYIYLLDKTCKLNCDILPYSEIEKAGAKMYLGVRGSSNSKKSGDQSENGGAIPTPTLHNSGD